MNVANSPPLDAAAGVPGNPGPAAQAGQPGAARDAVAGGQEGAANPLAGAPPLADRVDIQPLDMAAALQILVVELGMELALAADAPPMRMQTPMQAARVLIQMFLQAAPDPPAATNSTGTEAPDLWAKGELAFKSALDRAVETVAAWRNVPQGVVDGARETRALATRQLIDEPPSPLWLRPEWLGLAPRMERYWQRRDARRRLTDPDARPERDADAGDPDDAAGTGADRPAGKHALRRPER